LDALEPEAQESIDSHEAKETVLFVKRC
jgi:hypothetical protein